MAPLRAPGLNCTLKSGPAPSSTEILFAELYQALADVGFTIPANGVTYWVGEAVGSTDYRDLEKTPDAVGSATAMVARNAAHLAGLLHDANYPAAG